MLLLIECDTNVNPTKIVVNPIVNQMFDNYVVAWSNQEYEKISNEIYDVPFTLYLKDSTIVFNTKKEIEIFLRKTFKELEKNNYGYSVRNKWEHYKEGNDLVVIGMNYTRFYKDSTVMGNRERNTSYILRRNKGKYKITALTDFTNVNVYWYSLKKASF